MQNFIRAVREARQAPDPPHVRLPPTVPVLAGVSLMAARGDELPATLTMMGGRSTRAKPTAVNDFATRRPLSWFEQHVIQRVPVKYEGAMRRVYQASCHGGGLHRNESDRHFESHVDYYHHLVEGDGDSADAHRRFYDGTTRSWICRPSITSKPSYACSTNSAWRAVPWK